MENLNHNISANTPEKALNEGIKPRQTEKPAEKQQEKKPAGFALSRLVPALALIAAGLLSMTPADAQAATATASVTIQAPVTIAATSPLNFATVIPGATSGIVKLTGAGVRSILSGGTLLGSATGQSNASFTVTGAANAMVVVSPPPAAVALSDGASHTIMLSVGQGSGSPAWDGTPTSLGAGGTLTFNIGGTLAVGTPATTPSGTYSGSFDYTVAYQ